MLAASLVGGNHPVTVQVDNMISGTQDDEDTQSDGAEVEAEEEQSEEAKVAADPEDQPAATETPKEEKRQKKKHRKGKQPRTALTVLPQTKNTSQKAKNWHSSMIIPARSPC